MKYLVFFALIAVAAAKPMPGYLSGLDIGGHGLEYEPSYEVGHAAPVIQTVHAAPIIHAPIAIAKQATSYSSFQRVIHPESHHIVKAAPIVHAKLIQSAPVLSLQSHEPISYGHSLGHDLGHDLGHGLGHGW